MKQLTRGKIDGFLTTVERRYPVMTASDKVKALSFIESLPLDHADVERIRALGDDIDFGPAAQSKIEQRCQDAEDALIDAAETGVDSLSGLCHWLGIPEDSSVNEIIDRAHLYRRIGQRGRPETTILPV